MTFDATAAARVLAEHGYTDSDAATHADLIAAADIAGCGHPTRDQQDDIRTALDAIGDAR